MKFQKLIRMFLRFLTCLTLLLSNACGYELSDSLANNKITEVENNLQSVIYINGEQKWNLRDRMAHYGVPGVSIAVIKDSKIDWLKGYGIKDSISMDSITENTLFRAGSISKPISAFAALKMVENGILSIDSPIVDKLHSWKIPENNFTTNYDITLRNLLSHTAGFNYSGGGGYEQPPFPKLLEALNGTFPATNEAVRVVEKPNKRHRYSGGGYSVMQQLMIDVMDQDFETITKKLVFDPLEMTSSTFKQIPLPEELHQRAAMGHLESKQAIIPNKSYYDPMLAPGGLWTTAEDLAKFAIDIQNSLRNNSGKVLSRETVIEMSTPYLSDSYGLGIVIRKKGESEYLLHNGAAPGFTAHMFLHRTDGYGLVVLQNAMEVSLLNEIDRSIADAYGWDGFLEPSYTKIEIDSTEFSRIAGKYKYGFDRLYKIFKNKHQLFIQYLGSSPIELVLIDENTYVRRDRTNRYSFIEQKQGEDSEIHCVITLENGKKISNNRLGPEVVFPSEWVDSNNFEKAFVAYKEMLSQTPDVSDQVMNRLIDWGINIAYQDREFEKGIKIIRLSTRLFPSSAKTWVNLAWTYNEAGDVELAAKYYAKTLSLDPSNEFAQRELELLSN